MRIIVALGGNALAKRGEPITVGTQRANVESAVRAIGSLVQGNDLIITHGNGPQVGLLALQGAAYDKAAPYPLDVLGAETEGMIGYLLEQELVSHLPSGRSVATLLTMVEVDSNDPAFKMPTKFIGPVYEQSDAQDLEKAKGWQFASDGPRMRRVVPSPEPLRIVEIEPIRWLLERHAIVIAVGGGGVPVIREGDTPSRLVGVEAVVDKDLATELLAREIGADLLLLLTDVDAVYLDWGKPTQRPLRHVAPGTLKPDDFSAGSMRPKVEAACRFVAHAGKPAMIGALDDLPALLRGDRGTRFDVA
jgi:carbamate kinase